MGRTCDRCHAKMPAFQPRKKVGDDLCCHACASGRPGGGNTQASRNEFQVDGQTYVMGNGRRPSRTPPPPVASRRPPRGGGYEVTTAVAELSRPPVGPGPGGNTPASRSPGRTAHPRTSSFQRLADRAPGLPPFEGTLQKHASNVELAEVTTWGQEFSGQRAIMAYVVQNGNISPAGAVVFDNQHLVSVVVLDYARGHGIARGLVQKMDEAAGRTLPDDGYRTTSGDKLMKALGRPQVPLVKRVTEADAMRPIQGMFWAFLNASEDDPDLRKLTMKKGAPFAGYDSFDDCVSKNQDKGDPNAYCGAIKNQVEGRRQANAFDDFSVQWGNGRAPGSGPVWDHPDESAHDAYDRYFIQDTDAIIEGGPSGPLIVGREEGLALIEDLRRSYPNRKHYLVPATDQTASWGRSADGGAGGWRLGSRWYPPKGARYFIIEETGGSAPYGGSIVDGPFPDADAAHEALIEEDYGFPRDQLMVTDEFSIAPSTRNENRELFPREGSRRKVAHDHGDGETIQHCPFCGGGNVHGRSDGTAWCDFCQSAFTVQVQPEHSAMPQTVNGEPFDMPGMPGEPEPDPLMNDDPEQPVPGQDAPPVPGQDEPLPGQDEPQWVTSAGRRLSTNDYVAHLAIKHAPDGARTQVVRAVKTARRNR